MTTEIILIAIVAFALKFAIDLYKHHSKITHEDSSMQDIHQEAERPFVALQKKHLIEVKKLLDDKSPKAEPCPHKGEKTDIVVKANTVCEKIYTMCDDCNEVLNNRTDC